MEDQESKDIFHVSSSPVNPTTSSSNAIRSIHSQIRDLKVLVKEGKYHRVIQWLYGNIESFQSKCCHLSSQRKEVEEEEQKQSTKKNSVQKLQYPPSPEKNKPKQLVLLEDYEMISICECYFECIRKLSTRYFSNATPSKSQLSNLRRICERGYLLLDKWHALMLELIAIQQEKQQQNRSAVTNINEKSMEHLSAQKEQRQYEHGLIEKEDSNEENKILFEQEYHVKSLKKLDRNLTFHAKQLIKSTLRLCFVVSQLSRIEANINAQVAATTTASSSDQTSHNDLPSQHLLSAPDNQTTSNNNQTFMRDEQLAVEKMNSKVLKKSLDIIARISHSSNQGDEFSDPDLLLEFAITHANVANKYLSKHNINDALIEFSHALDFAQLSLTYAEKQRHRSTSRTKKYKSKRKQSTSKKDSKKSSTTQQAGINITKSTEQQLFEATNNKQNVRDESPSSNKAVSLICCILIDMSISYEIIENYSQMIESIRTAEYIASCFLNDSSELRSITQNLFHQSLQSYSVLLKERGEINRILTWTMPSPNKLISWHSSVSDSNQIMNNIKRSNSSSDTSHRNLSRIEANNRHKEVHFRSSSQHNSSSNNNSNQINANNHPLNAFSNKHSDSSSYYDRIMYEKHGCAELNQTQVIFIKDIVRNQSQQSSTQQTSKLKVELNSLRCESSRSILNQTSLINNFNQSAQRSQSQGRIPSISNRLEYETSNQILNTNVNLTMTPEHTTKRRKGSSLHTSSMNSAFASTTTQASTFANDNQQQHQSFFNSTQQFDANPRQVVSRRKSKHENDNMNNEMNRGEQSQSGEKHTPNRGSSRNGSPLHKLHLHDSTDSPNNIVSYGQEQQSQKQRQLQRRTSIQSEQTQSSSSTKSSNLNATKLSEQMSLAAQIVSRKLISVHPTKISSNNNMSSNYSGRNHTPVGNANAGHASIFTTDKYFKPRQKEESASESQQKQLMLTHMPGSTHAQNLLDQYRRKEEIVDFDGYFKDRIQKELDKQDIHTLDFKSIGEGVQSMFKEEEFDNDEFSNAKRLLKIKMHSSRSRIIQASTNPRSETYYKYDPGASNVQLDFKQSLIMNDQESQFNLKKCLNEAKALNEERSNQRIANSISQSDEVKHGSGKANLRPASLHNLQYVEINNLMSVRHPQIQIRQKMMSVQQQVSTPTRVAGQRKPSSQQQQ